MTERGRRRPGLEEDTLAEAVEALGVLLEAGVAPESAWGYLAEDSSHPAIGRVARAVSAGERPGDALALVSVRAGPAVRTVAAAWQVAEAAGAALSPVLRGAGASLRDRAETAREVEAALSGPRATSRLMTALPLVGLLMAAGLGIDVLGAITGSLIGWGLLVAGVGLTFAGRAWMSRLVRSATATGPVAGIGLDLMGAALAGGLSVPGARRLIGEVRERAGLDTGDDHVLDRVLRIEERAGAPVADLLASASRQERRSARVEGRARAATLAVRLLLPLGVCVLPAFLVLGVAPVILAMISSTVIGLR
ncbi:type II secretion system F family protein [Leifsonia xyli]|uniref:type II secretion system F family protein n=1 Tax=Leifsonia xyli TaxID=1575 RepID=UPI0002E5711A|nr:type II secretion system F family protein [Leifsonia xyli]